MSPSFKHEGYGKAFEHLIDILATESDIDHTSWGTATFRRPDLERGLEPDCCYYFGHWQDVAHEEEIRLENDPPPDLVIEIEISRSVSIDRMALYAAFSVPEVWRFDGEHLTVQVLNDGRYEGRERSPLFPAIPPDGLAPFLRRYGREPIRTWKAEFLAWVRERMGA